jgi:hypothetical protein
VARAALKMRTTIGVRFLSSHQLADVSLTEDISVNLYGKLNGAHIEILVNVYYYVNVQQLVQMLWLNSNLMG